MTARRRCAACVRGTCGPPEVNPELTLEGLRLVYEAYVEREGSGLYGLIG